jgi:hypothetical protein
MSKKSFEPSLADLSKYFDLRVEGKVVYFSSSYEISQAIGAELKANQIQVERHRIYVGNQISISEEIDLETFVETGGIRRLFTADWMKNYLNQFISGSEKGDLMPQAGAEGIQS